MKASRSAIAPLLSLSAVLLATACVPAPDSTPTPEEGAVAVPPPPPPQPTVTPPAQPTGSLGEIDSAWLDQPRTPGEWRYVTNAMTTQAVYFDGSRGTLLTLSCDEARTVVDLVVHDQSVEATPLRILTETADRVFIARQIERFPDRLQVSLDARDPLLDAIALTKGRFAVETPNSPTLYLPAWAEVTRVIEDCR